MPKGELTITVVSAELTNDLSTGWFGKMNPIVECNIQRNEFWKSKIQEKGHKNP